MAEDSDLERTEQPTGRRLEKAREEGQVPQSRELGAFLVLIAGAAVMWTLGGYFVDRMLSVFKKGFAWDRQLATDSNVLVARLADVATDAVFALWPLFLVLIVAALASPVFLNAWHFSGKAFSPRLNRLNPMNGIGRIFSWNGLVELLKAVVKAGLVGGVAVWVIWREIDQLLGLASQPLESGLADAGHLMAWSFLVIASAMVLIVAADVPFQLWQYYDKLKMTKEEVKQEMKEMEGSPEVKGRIRQLMREAARKRMMSAIPKADVIVTNPTHFAVALAYQAGMKAPKVVAKGLGVLALKIREIGAENGVPFLEAPPLARALYKHVELEAEIPGDLYTAVAEVLAYVYQLRRYRSEGGDYPVPPRDLPVPPELVPPAPEEPALAGALNG